MSASSSPSNTAHARRRAAHLGPERRRPLILDVALQLFMEHGYRGTSMEAVARAAGVTKPVVYDCFASKADLFGALLEREEQRMFDQFGAALAAGGGLRTAIGSGADDGSGVEDGSRTGGSGVGGGSRAGGSVSELESLLSTGFTLMLRAVVNTPTPYSIVLLEGVTDPVIGARVRRGREQRVAAIAVVARGWLQQRTPTDRLDAAARFVGHTLVGIGEAGARMILSEPTRWTPETLGRALAGLALHGYATLVSPA